MQLSNTGVIAYILWHEIKNHAQNVKLGEFVVMPNHVHGIILKRKWFEYKGKTFKPLVKGGLRGQSPLKLLTAEYITITGQPRQPEQQQKNTRKTRFQNIGKNSISSIIGSYKSAVTKYARRLGYEFEWQTRFYDNIIRNQEDYNKISNYIKRNPDNWPGDRFFNG